ncbi:MAG TPA: hypothetical protein VNQ34_07220 [Xanthobacteraceae bacterium]|nr:hypothetical protein [Xanthobacteraceae bacterium]
MAARRKPTTKRPYGTSPRFANHDGETPIIAGALYERRVTTITGDDAARDLMLHIGLLFASGEGAGALMPAKPLRLLIVTSHEGVADEIAGIVEASALFPRDRITIHGLEILGHDVWIGTESLPKVVNVSSPRLVIVDDVPLAVARSYLGDVRAAVLSTEPYEISTKLSLMRRDEHFILTNAESGVIAQFERDGKRFRAASGSISALVRAKATRDTNLSARQMLDEI